MGARAQSLERRARENSIERSGWKRGTIGRLSGGPILANAICLISTNVCMSNLRRLLITRINRKQKPKHPATIVTPGEAIQQIDLFKRSIGRWTMHPHRLASKRDRFPVK